jgi:hypothetical protein
MRYLDFAVGMAGLAGAFLGPERNRYTYVREEKKISRNASCPCGSGKKYKKCCALINNIEQTESDK